MTSEVALLNRSAVAMAADSAVTVDSGASAKIYNSVNKLFTLSKYKPVGIMVFGGADFLGVPWETIVKLYREKIKDGGFDTILEYRDDFLSFIKSKTFCSQEATQRTAFSIFYSEFKDIESRALSEMAISISESRRFSQRKFGTIVSEIAENRIKSLSLEGRFFDKKFASLKKFNDFYANAAQRSIESAFNKIGITRRAEKSLVRLAQEIVVRDVPNSSRSGLVFAGFGDEEIFPSLEAVSIGGVFFNFLKFSCENSVDISRSGTGAQIIPFAQRDMVERFIDGVDSRYDSYVHKLFQQTLIKYAAAIISESLKGGSTYDKSKVTEFVREHMDELDEKLKNFRKENFINPILDVMVYLPKEELAEMAEALISLTSIKRRVSAELETVGGPIDVAVISKGDGFVWIKRKHYFDPSLNHHFLKNYFGSSRTVPAL